MVKNLEKPGEVALENLENFSSIHVDFNSKTCKVLGLKIKNMDFSEKKMQGHRF